MTAAEQREHERQNLAIESVADALLSVCALQTGTDPAAAAHRAVAAIASVIAQAGQEQLEPTPALVEAACIVMHDAYEQAAAGAGWQTNPASRRPWPDVPPANQATMRTAVAALLAWLECVSCGRADGEPHHPDCAEEIGT